MNSGTIKKKKSPIAIIGIIVLIIILILGIVAGIGMLARQKRLNDLNIMTAENTTIGLFDQVRLYYLEQSLENPNMEKQGDLADIPISGTRPDSGRWKMDEEGNVRLFNVIYGDVICDADMENGVTCEMK